MSCPHVVWALRQRGLTASERVVLIYLADKANGSMICWPTLMTIAEAVELSRRTVQSATVRLAELQLIRIDARHRHSHTYHILRPNGRDGGDPIQPEVSETENREQDLHPNKVQELHPRTVEVQELHPKQGALPAKFAPKPAGLVVNLAPHPPKKESPKGRKEERGAQGSRLPPDWTPTPGCIAFAVGRGLDPATVAEAFADYWRARAGQGACKRDWEATWRTWCRNERPPRAAPQQPRGKLDWAIASIMSEARH